ncbi:UvrB/UvrC motif-containing protein [Cytobacillus gottheilii]|uniref:UvrB/UvrC motif-containing protein n=1 Tax=Cytobacillus gottheilii TaxID=859144 RepID=UPI0009BA9835|nr:UvrB/UvrC motif-containing protein [Cytobacillus gottheilii]
MVCQECNQRPATLHFTKIVNGEKAEFQLCEKCAAEKGEMFMFNNGQNYSIHNLLAGLLNVQPAYQGSSQNAFQNEKVIQCPNCSMTYKQFIKIGRFGCAECYETFSEQLPPIFRRLHSGNETHNGKIPARIGGSIHLRKNIEELKHKMKEFIANEEFEEAAITRDEIRKLEKELNSAHEEGE